MRIERLKNIGDFYSGLSGKSKEDFVNGNALFVTYSNIFNNSVLNLNIKDTVVVKDGEKQNEVKCGDILFTGSSETPDEAGMSSVVLSEPKEKMYLNSFCFGFRLKQSCEILPEYMGYILRSKNIRSKISRTAFGVTRFNINKTRLADIEIPIPSLCDQQKIVSILDSFTTLIDKMKSEVEKRKKQMEYYRHYYFSLELEQYEKKALRDICDTLSGYPFDSSKFTDEGIRLMRGMNIKRGFFDFNQEDDRYWETSKGLEKYLLEENDIIVSMDGSLVGKSFAFLSSEYLPLLLVQRVARIRAKSALPKYIYHFISYGFPEYVAKKKTTGAIPHISMKDIESYEIPVPSIETQAEIVSKLDKFETYITKLEKLIDLRQKQYEYYREKLLTFE